MSTRTLILASGSPRRRELLALSGLPFEVQSADVLEVPEPGESPADFVVRMSAAKARLVAAARANGHNATELIIGADTVVALDSEILGKPAGPQDALDM